MNVLNVLELRKNLVSVYLLCKSGMKIILESDKSIVTKSGALVGKGYACDGTFKPSINKISVMLILLIC